MSRDLRVQLIAGVIMIVALVFSGAMATQVSASTGRNRLTYMDSAEEGDPPQVGLGIAMGAFRGLFVNMLWMRANDLKEEGKYYEAMELARAITRLQPRFNQVWVFHAWNMAYNISVTTQTKEERWQWVNNGIRLLRDEGLRYNPNDMLIHKELSWIFLHKVGGYTDDANGYYKRELAAEWTEVLGAPPAPTPEILRSKVAAVEAYVAWLRPIADAPDTLEAAIERTPEVATLIERLRAAGGRVDHKLVEFHSFYMAMESSGRRGLYESQMADREKTVVAIAADPELAEAWATLLAHLRRRILLDRYNMEPERMIRYTQKYGPIDWRLPAAHALYWAVRGVEQGLDRATQANRKDWDFVNTDRMIIQSVQELYRSGELYYGYLEFRTGTYTMWDAVPNVHFFETYGSILQELAMRSWAEKNRIGGTAFSFYSAGYENFLKDGVRFFYRRGQRAEAEEVLRIYRTWPGRNLNITNTMRIQEDSMTLEEFIAGQYDTQRWSSPYVAQAEVSGALQGSFSALLAGDGEMFESQFNFASQFHAKYFEVQSVGEVTTGQENRRMEQLEPDFRFLAGSAFARFMSMVDFQYAERVYDLAPQDLKQFAYDFLQGRYREGLEQVTTELGGRGFEEIFPEPPGMEPFRVWYMTKLAQRSEEGRDVEAR